MSLFDEFKDLIPAKIMEDVKKEIKTRKVTNVQLKKIMER